MNPNPKFDIAIIGGGLAGLTAAIIAAREGRSVIVLERAPHLGGRASTQNKEGFFFNQGPHALYRGGHGIQILRDLGVSYHGAQASYEGSWVLRDGQKYPLPGTPEALMSTPLLSQAAKLEAAGVFVRLMSEPPTEEWKAMTVRQWLDSEIRNPDLRLLFEGYIRLSTYCDDDTLQNAAAALEQFATGREGVDYLDEGWQSLVDRLRDAAIRDGVRIETRAAVDLVQCQDGLVTIRTGGETVSARSAILTTSPSITAALVNGGSVSSLRHWAQDIVPVHAACLDVALKRLPSPEHQFAIGLDRPIYFSVHTRSARLAPPGGVVIQVAKYLRSGASGSAEELEGILDEMQPGWRDELVAKRYLPQMIVTNAVVTSAGRPGPSVPGLPNLFVAGDWVGPHGMLADTSFASARDAARLATTHLAVVDGVEVSQTEAAA